MSLARLREAVDTVPVGDCFGYANTEAKNHPGSTVCHGIVHHPWSGKKIRHAWVEDGEQIHDWQSSHGMRNKLDKATFYSTWKPTQVKRYTPEQAAINMLRHGHHGPWK